MINKQEDKKPVEDAKVETSAHLLIRDKKTGKVIVNQRG